MNIDKKQLTEYRCNQCNIKTSDWDTHIESKEHIVKFQWFQKNIFYVDKGLFDSGMVSREVIVNIPKVKWKKSIFKVEK